MIPLNRKERYLNQIVGWGNTAPEKPQTPEEFFFSAILGEDVQLPDLKNATRYELFLAKIAGININISPPTYTSPRIEFFLARAAGMNVPELVPLTREEIFWSNYVAVVEKILEGLPPLTYKAKKAGTLTDYRIYGQTSRNLFDELWQQGYWAFINGSHNNSPKWICSLNKIPCIPNTYYTFKYFDNSRYYSIGWYNTDGQYISMNTGTIMDNTGYRIFTAISPNNATYMAISIAGYPNDYSEISVMDAKNLMLVEGTTPLPYEPYGESVGDRTGNLFDGEFLQGYWAGADGNFTASNKWICTQKIPCKANSDYTFTFGITSRWYGFAWYDIDGNYIESAGSTIESQPTILTATSPANAAFMGIDSAGGHVGTTPLDIYPSDVTDFMLVEGSTALPYETYGYRVPVTVSNGDDSQTIPIYLSEQIKKVGDEAEYIDYGQQKQHRVRKNLLQNTATSQTINNVTFTVNSDGSVTCNGTASTTVLYIISSEAFSLPVGRYKLNGAPTGGGTNYNFKLDVRVSTNTYYPDTGNGIRFNILQGELITKCRLVIYSGYTCNNLTFYPMIRKADIEDDTYEPYIENTELDVTLPALPTVTGTNVLSVGTEVQPSKVYVKYKGERQ